MLRITVRGAPALTQGPVCLILEGRIVDAWVSELERVWKATRHRVEQLIPIQVELKSVSHISRAGAALLREMESEGAQFIAKTPLMSAYIEDLRGCGACKSVAAQLPILHTGCHSRGSQMKKRQDPSISSLKKNDEPMEPSHQRIAIRAYEIWLNEGGQHGHHQEHWLKAESELRAQSAEAS